MSSIDKINVGGVDFGIDATVDASNVSFNKGESDLSSTNTNAAILEVNNKTNELNQHLTASDNLKFRFATDGEGNHGYLGADGSFIPFKSGYKYIGGTLNTPFTLDPNTNKYIMNGNSVLAYDGDNGTCNVTLCPYVYGTTYTPINNEYMQVTCLNQYATVKAKVDCVRLNTNGTTAPISAGTSISVTPQVNIGAVCLLAFE